jgi:NADPH:quinone reductase
MPATTAATTAATLPATIQAVEITKPGPADGLKLGARPTPQPGPGEVLVSVAAAGVNRPDVVQREGRYPPPPGASDIPGLEVAGTVVALGSGVTDWKLGDRLCALVSGGGYASHCVVPVPQALPIPGALSLVEAASLPETFFTVWDNLFTRGRLRAGETALIHGGTSGIGVTAIQLAKAFGARVIVTVGSEDKRKAALRLGADRAVNYREDDFVAAAKEDTQGRGVDVILDMVAGDYTPRNIECLAFEGRIALISLQRGAKAEVNLGTILTRRLSLMGSTLRPRSVAEKGVIAAELKRQVWPLIEKGVIRPVVHATFPLAKAADAHRLMESSAHIGKIVLVTDGTATV